MTVYDAEVLVLENELTFIFTVQLPETILGKIDKTPTDPDTELLYP